MSTQSSDEIKCDIKRFQTSDDVLPKINLETEYISTHANIAAMLANLTEFINSIPAPDDDNKLPPSVSWAVLGDYKRIEAAMIEVSRVADQIGK